MVVVVDPEQRTALWDHHFDADGLRPPYPRTVVLHFGVECALSEACGPSQSGYRTRMGDWVCDHPEYKWLGDLFQDYPCDTSKLEPLTPSSLFGRFAADPLRQIWFLFRSLNLKHVTGHSFCVSPLLRHLVFDPNSLLRLSLHHCPGKRGVSQQLIHEWREMDCQCLSKACGPIHFVPLPKLKVLQVVLGYRSSVNQLPNLIMRAGYLTSPLDSLVVEVLHQDDRFKPRRPNSAAVQVTTKSIRLGPLSRDQLQSFLSSPHCGKAMEELSLSCWHEVSMFRRSRESVLPPSQFFLRTLRNLRVLHCDSTFTGIMGDIKLGELVIVEKILQLVAVRETIEKIYVMVQSCMECPGEKPDIFGVSVGGVFPKLRRLCLRSCEFLDTFRCPNLIHLMLRHIGLFAPISSNSLEVITFQNVMIEEGRSGFSRVSNLHDLSCLFNKVKGDTEGLRFENWPTVTGLKGVPMLRA